METCMNLQPQPRPKRILGGWDNVINEVIECNKNIKNEKEKIKETAREIAIDAVKEKEEWERKSNKEKLMSGIKIAQTISYYIQNYWEAIGGWKMMSGDKKKINEHSQYKEVVEIFKSCPLPNESDGKEDPMNILKKIGGLTKNQMAEVVNTVESVKRCQINTKEDICIVEEVKAGIVLYKEIPPIIEIFNNFNGEKLPVLIVLKDERTKTSIIDLLPCFAKYSQVIALNDSDEETIGRVANGISDVIIVTHSILKQCLKQISQRKFDLIVYENELTESNDLNTPMLLTNLQYDSLLLFITSLQPCFPRYLSLLFPNDLPTTFWQRCNISHIESLAQLLRSLILTVSVHPPSTLRQINAPLPLKLIKPKEFNNPPKLEIPQFPEFLIIKSDIQTKKYDIKNLDNQRLNDAMDEVILKRKIIPLETIHLPKLPEVNLLDSLRRCQSLQPLLDIIDLLIRNKQKFAVVTQNIRFICIVLHALQIIRPTPIVILKKFEDTAVLAGIYKLKGGCVIVSDECVDALRYFNVESVILINSSIGLEIKSIVGAVDVVLVGEKINNQIISTINEKKEKKIDEFARNNYIPCERVVHISKEKLVESILENLYHYKNQKEITTSSNNEIKEENVNTLNTLTIKSNKPDISFINIPSISSQPPLMSVVSTSSNRSIPSPLNENKNIKLPLISTSLQQPIPLTTTSQELETNPIINNNIWDNEIQKIEKKITKKIEDIKKEEKILDIINKLKNYKEKEFLKESDVFKPKENSREGLKQVEIPSLLFKYTPSKYEPCTELKKLNIPIIELNQIQTFYLNPLFIHLAHSDYRKRTNDMLPKKSLKSSSYTQTHPIGPQGPIRIEQAMQYQTRRPIGTPGVAIPMTRYVQLNPAVYTGVTQFNAALIPGNPIMTPSINQTVPQGLAQPVIPPLTPGITGISRPVGYGGKLINGFSIPPPQPDAAQVGLRPMTNYQNQRQPQMSTMTPVFVPKKKN
ncbi:hypothetical protein EDI_197940 [Entamoeba dispar SAW760]|uniref:Uncharacterized protein n=1 Tax=Entamoeba dispar (strain ATCC PRA-260 / SAW760) TaxID=370354 RepID=B0EPG0_ENTDS|nr:uncharacterized protein EDI_197940 [Entamoeba dispar SAW760]EDR23568.1 hypothetical protein EDI_197940 [Entamoeba dispar SAW760]|eukprot:EDR23568.1 hypothetical protein EDI_197940 [Entamoeba dispar SAW760]